ncbi:Transmembrane protein 161A/B [Gracilaria domingensis]|nr:Transmembrane protein 161A/B [Gracilaria domingensis]
MIPFAWRPILAAPRAFTSKSHYPWGKADHRGGARAASPRQISPYTAPPPSDGLSTRLTMAILSPALVVAMCVMFILTRLHSHFYIFEHPLLFGIKYCVEPEKTHLEAIAQAVNKGSQPAKKKGKQSSAGSKITVSALPVRRGKITAAFFPTESEFPHHRELAHITGILCGYLAAFLFEDVVGCFFPNLLANKRSVYVAFFAIAFSLYELYVISTSLTSRRAMIALTAASWMVSIFILSAGDFQHFIKFDKAFASLRSEVEALLVDRVGLDFSKAHGYARNAAIGARVFVSAFAALIAASSAVPARRFSRIDYDLNLQYRMDIAEHQNDPYSLGPPTPLTMIRIALDYAVPLLTAFLWAVTPRDEDTYSGWRIMALLLCVVIRMSMARIRLQGYLDGAIDAYRRFWTEKSVNGVLEAGRQCSFQVIGTSFYLMLITVAYIAPSVITLLLALVAKHDGGLRMSFCRPMEVAHGMQLDTFFHEVAGFLAWWSMASYALFASLSILSEFLIDFVDPSGRDRRKKLPTATSSSERRREKRLVQERIMRNRLKPAV